MENRNKLSKEKLHMFDYYNYKILTQSICARKQGKVIDLENGGAVLLWGISVFIGGEFSKENAKKVFNLLNDANSTRYIYTPDKKWYSFIKENFSNRIKDKYLNLYKFNNEEIKDYNKDEHIVRVTREFIEQNFKNTQCIIDELYSYTDLEDYYKNGLGVALVIDNEVVGFCLSEYSINQCQGANIWVDARFRGLGYSNKLAYEFLICCNEKNQCAYWACNEDNLKSNKIAKATGFVYESTQHFFELQ